VTPLAKTLIEALLEKFPEYLEPDRPAVRVCLACDMAFRSRGPGNRICGYCKEDPSRIEIDWGALGCHIRDVAEIARFNLAVG
jgi:hypothetical protein